MPISVICPSCHTRFKVGDQHAGKTGACPKCKGPITIPAEGEEVIIHAPEMELGAKNAQGKSVLKPIRRKETKFSANMTVMVVGVALLGVALAWLLGHSDLGDNQTLVLAAGAVVLGPLAAYAGYTFLRDDELGGYEGTSLLWRSLSCGLVYALLWGVFVFLGGQIFGDDAFQEGLEMVQILGLGVPILAIGAGAAFVCFDLEPVSGFFHYALYLLITVGLRFVMGLPFLPGMVPGTG